MKNILKLTILFIAIIMGFSCENNTVVNTQIITDGDEEILREIKEVKWPKAYAEQDTVLLDELLGDDFQLIDHTGSWYTKDDELNWIKSHASGYDSFRFEIKRLDIFSNGTAIICGTGHILNDTIETLYQSSNILIKRDGKWEAVLSHVSGVKTAE